jgi:hypothetical protein
LDLLGYSRVERNHSYFCAGQVGRIGPEAEGDLGPCRTCPWHLPLYGERPLADRAQSCLIEIPITAALNHLNVTYRAMFIDEHS